MPKFKVSIVTTVTAASKDIAETAALARAKEGAKPDEVLVEEDRTKRFNAVIEIEDCSGDKDDVESALEIGLGRTFNVFTLKIDELHD